MSQQWSVCDIQAIEAQVKFFLITINLGWATYDAVVGGVGGFRGRVRFSKVGVGGGG